MDLHFFFPFSFSHWLNTVAAQYNKLCWIRVSMNGCFQVLFYILGTGVQWACTRQ